jgi:hypothetical protein
MVSIMESIRRKIIPLLLGVMLAVPVLASSPATLRAAELLITTSLAPARKADRTTPPDALGPTQ